MIEPAAYMISLPAARFIAFHGRPRPLDLVRGGRWTRFPRGWQGAGRLDARLLAAPRRDGATSSLSEVIPTHNRPGMLSEAVASALAACPPEAEIVVVDDHSQTSAAKVLAGQGPGQVRVIPNAGPPGASGARNTGVAAARGAVVLFLDDDDWMLPGYPARVIAAAGEAQATAFGFCATEPKADRSRHPQGAGFLSRQSPLRRRLIAFSAGFWIHRDLYLSLGGCDPAQRVDEDTEFCCRLAARGLMPWYDPTLGVRLRTAPDHADRLTRATPETVIVACYRRTWERHQHSFALYSEARRHPAVRLIRRALRCGLPQEARDDIAVTGPAPFLAALWPVFHAKRLGRALGRDRTGARNRHA